MRPSTSSLVLEDINLRGLQPHQIGTHPVIMLKPSLNSLIPQLFSASPTRLPNSALHFTSQSLSLQQSSSSSLSRREFVSQTTTISVSLLAAPPARSEDALSDWERVYLPIDPGVVLLDIAFVPDDLNHGLFNSYLSSFILFVYLLSDPSITTWLLVMVGFLLGTRQTIMETKDGGNTWAPRSIPSTEDEDFNYRFNSVSFKGNEGWIVGKPSILLYTSDSGNCWDRIPLSSQLHGDVVSLY